MAPCIMDMELLVGLPLFQKKATKPNQMLLF